MADHPNVLFLTVDALRSDRTSLYGYERPTTPVLEALAKDAVVCGNAVSTGAFTQVSFHTFMTSSRALSYGGYDRGAVGRPPSLFEVFHDAGYQTISLGTFAWISRYFGYTGIDRDAGYVADAKKRLQGTFLVADAADRLPLEGPFDFILVNSLLHHLDDTDARAVLASAADLVAEDGHVHVMDLVLPERPSPARKLAHLDRGDFPRPLGEWHTLFSERFEPVVFQPYAIRALGLPLWHMVYFKGRARLES